MQLAARGLTMSAPFELLNGPVTLYIAAEGTAAPEISGDRNVSTLPGGWTWLGTNGDRNYGDDGVTITPSRSYELQMVLGSTAPQKPFLTEQGFTVSVPIVDMSAETMARIMNGAAVTDLAAASNQGGHKSFDLMIADEAAQFALLIRGKSAYGDSYNAQHWIPKCFVSDVGEYSYVKGEAAATEVEFTALEHLTYGFGKYYVQDAAPA